MTGQPDLAPLAAVRDAYTDWSRRTHVAGLEAYQTFRDGFLAGARHAETASAEAGDREPAGAAR